MPKEGEKGGDAANPSETLSPSRGDYRSHTIKSDPQLWNLLNESIQTKEQQRMLGRWLEKISEWKNALVLPALVENDDERALYEAYNAQLRASGVLDYDDLLLLTYRLFIERPKVAEYYRRQYKYISIDEAQDLNEAQYRLLMSLCGSEFKNVLMVGDPRQAIYVWNGADPKYLDLFERDFGAKRVVLTENYRSSSLIVAAARRLDSSYSVEGRFPVEGAIELITCEDEQDEARSVVTTAQSLLLSGHPDIEGKISFGHFAVLGRNRFVFNALEEKLKSEEIPFYKKTSSSAYQSESDIVKQFELALRLLANPRDQLHLNLLLREWQIKPTDSEFSNTTLQQDPLAGLQSFADMAQSGYAQPVIDAVTAAQWTSQSFKLLNAIKSLEAFAKSLPEEARALVLQDTHEWKKHWDYYVRSEPGGFHSVSSFLSQVALGSTQQPKGDGIALLTVHAAKGMEFDIVFLIGMTEGTFPDYRAKGPSLEEEQRSAFVALTRSKRLLYVTYPKVRMMPWGDRKFQQPSRYISKLFV